MKLNSLSNSPKKVAKLQSRLEEVKRKGFKTHLLEEKLSKLWLKVKKLIKHFARIVKNHALRWWTVP